MLGIFLIIFLTIILFLILDKNYEKFIAKPSLVLNHIEKQTRKEGSVSPKLYERKGLLHKVKNCYDTRRKDYYECVKNLPLKLEKQPPIIKEKKYVNYGRYKNIQDLYPQSFK